MSKDLRSILRAHAARYPLMQPADAVKLLYQNEFGPGHSLPDAEAGCARLACERAATAADAVQPAAESIGNGLVRLHLAAPAVRELSQETLFRCFAATARRTGSFASLEAKLSVLCALCDAGELPFGSGPLAAYLTEFRASGCPAVSHSDAYRRAYRPAYRVAEAIYARFLPLLTRLDRLLAQGGRVVLAIDGRCGSGKTTLAALLSTLYCCAAVHMDDFFLPPALRTPERLAAPGGNVHYERFLEEVAPRLRAGRAFTYRRFDCGRMALAGEVAVADAPLLLVEGSYALRPELRPCYDLSVFLTVSPEEQRRRILARDGAEQLERFCTRWIPMEERYFAACTVQADSDLVFRTDEGEDGARLVSSGLRLCAGRGSDILAAGAGE